jgi:Biotin-requiring enzyme
VRTFGSKTISMQIVDQQRLLDIRAKEVFMPALSSTMTEGVIVAWLKKPGDKVTVGEMIMTVESDKADMDGTNFDVTADVVYKSFSPHPSSPYCSPLTNRFLSTPGLPAGLN